MNRFTKLITITVISLAMADYAIAQGFKLTPKLCKEYGLGKNWYCGKEKKEGSELKRPQEILAMDIPGEKKAELLNELWDVSRKRSVMDGKKEDIEIFLETNYLISKLALNFANHAQAVVEKTPVYSGETTAVEIEANREEVAREQKEIMEFAAKNYILGFAYDTDCQACHKQMVILLHFKKVTGFKILGITEGESYFDGLDHNMTDKELRASGMVKGLPTLILMDNRNGKKIFINRGVTSLDGLIERIVARIKELKK